MQLLTDSFFCKIITVLYNGVIILEEMECFMGIRGNDTAAAILEAGKREFLAYGYEKASLRRIAAKAGVTTGAIYGYFPGKEALFEALTGETAETLVETYVKVHKDFAALPPQEQPGMLAEITEEHIPQMIHYIYDHFDVFKLLLCCGAPGSKEYFFDRMAAVEEKSCWDFVDAMKALGRPVPELSETLIHILCRSFFQQLHEFVSHDVPREQALSCALVLSRFQHAGWLRIMEI